MNQFVTFSSLSHHAYCIIGHDSIRSRVLILLRDKLGISLQGNPDILDRHYDNFLIDDARELKSIHASKPMTAGGKKIFVISVDAITIEAQNALLKLLEEPADYAHFILIIPSPHLLLPTVKSRLSFIHVKSDSTVENSALINEEAESARKFIKDTPAKRLVSVSSILDEIKKEKKTKQYVINFLNALTSEVYKDRGPMEGSKSLEVIETARIYMNDRSPSHKMLLEYVAINI